MNDPPSVEEQHPVSMSDRPSVHAVLELSRAHRADLAGLEGLQGLEGLGVLGVPSHR